MRPRIACFGAIICVAAVAAAQEPRIVNGTLTSSFASTGALLLYEDDAQTQLIGLCSGTLIGCRTFVTAAHCVCGSADDFLTCTQSGVTPPDRVRVFFQQAGFVQVESVTISPDFSFGEAGDIAVLQLAQPVIGIAPSGINAFSKPTAGTGGTIVGFGRTINDSATLSDAGIKREGKVTVADCNRVVPNSAHVCWQFLGTDSSTCSGDSGGPLFIDFGDGPRLAGVTSGGSNDTCEAPDRSFDTDVFVYSAWVAEQIEDCAAVVPALDAVTLLSTNGDLTRVSADARFTVAVPADSTALRFALNGQLAGADFDLYVRAGSPPSTTIYDCADLAFSSFGACELSVSGAATWHALVHSSAGSGTFQLNVTALVESPPPPCSGDCNGNGAVDVEDLVTGVNIVLERDAASTCTALDENSDGTVTVEELVMGVGNALRGCVP
jgi:hypothetical protein